MPRRGNVPKREVLPDPMYGSVLVTKLVNSVMLDLSLIHISSARRRGKSAIPL